MRFRFCGDADCPDWVLSEINSLSRLSSIKLKLLAQAIADSWTDEKGLNISKVRKLLTDSKLDNIEDLKATIACINFILNSAVRHGCDEAVLTSELQQLGLPQEHSQSLRRVYLDRQENLIKKYQLESLQYNQLTDIKISNNSDGIVTLDLTINGNHQHILVAKKDLPSLIKNLKTAQEIVKQRLS